MRVTVSILRSRSGKAIQKPVPIVGDLNMDKHGFVHLFKDSGGMASLAHARVAEISRDGFMIEGLEEIAAETYRWQEWWCRPALEASRTEDNG